MKQGDLVVVVEDGNFARGGTELDTMSVAQSYELKHNELTVRWIVAR